MLLIEAVVSFAAFWFLFLHLPTHIKHWIVRHKGWFDVTVHGFVLIMFFGTFEGLMQAELCAILWSLYLRGYHKVLIWREMRERLAFATRVDEYRNRLLEGEVIR